MEATLDIKPRLELLALLGIINVIDELVDPVFNLTVHLIVSGIALLEGNRRFTGCIHEILTTSSAFTERAAPLGGAKKYCGSCLIERSSDQINDIGND